MKSLLELKRTVEKAPAHEGRLRLRRKWLLESGAEIVEHAEIGRRYNRYGEPEPEYTLDVFDNGYVLYDDGSKYTVFPLHETCSGDYEYYADEADKEIGTKYLITESAFDLMPWTTRVLLEAIDRAEHNAETGTIVRNTDSYSAFENELMFLADLVNNGLVIVIHNEMIRTLSECLAELTHDQRAAFIICVGYGRRPTDLARAMNITKQTACYYRDCALDSIRDMFEAKGYTVGKERNYPRAIKEKK